MFEETLFLYSLPSNLKRPSCLKRTAPLPSFTEGVCVIYIITNKINTTKKENNHPPILVQLHYSSSLPFHLHPYAKTHIAAPSSTTIAEAAFIRLPAPVNVLGLGALVPFVIVAFELALAFGNPDTVEAEAGAVVTAFATVGVAIIVL
jgi:hypothetical protein